MRLFERLESTDFYDRLYKVGKVVGFLGCVALLGGMVAGSFGSEVGGEVAAIALAPIAIGGVALVASEVPHSPSM
jgi:hypothetical protein